MAAAAEDLDHRRRDARVRGRARRACRRCCQSGTPCAAAAAQATAERGRDDGVAAERGLLRRAVERDQRAVDAALVGRVHAPQRRRDRLVDRRDRAH